VKYINSLSFVIILLSFVTTVYAIDCKENDKYPDWRSSLGPIRDQDTIGWCYAFAASDILTDYINRHPSSRPDKLSDADFTKKENMVSPLPGGIAVDSGVVALSSNMSMIHNVDKNFSYDALLENNNKLKKINEDYKVLCNNDCKDDCIYSYVHHLDYSGLNCNTLFESRAKDLPQIINLYNAVKDLENKQQDGVNNYYGSTLGGNTELVLDYYIKNGFSLESQFPTDNFNKENKLSRLSYDFALAYGTALSKEEAVCSSYKVYKESCSSCRETIEDIRPILEKIFNSNNSPLYEITNSDKFKFKTNGTDNLDVKRFSYLPKGPLDQKGKDIDEGLKTGIVGISYDVAGVVSLNSGGHASSLVGKKCIGGQEHYILRNSWGGQACESNKKKMVLDRLKDILKDKNPNDFLVEYSSCMDTCKKIITKSENFYEFAPDDPKKVLEKEECKNSCYTQNKNKLAKVVETYECDEAGYYFIKSEKILDAISGVQYITPKL
jgi:hypothetical protein